MKSISLKLINIFIKNMYSCYEDRKLSSQVARKKIHNFAKERNITLKTKTYFLGDIYTVTASPR